MFNKKEDTNRFSADIDELMDTNQNVDIIVDKNTKVQYLVVSQGGAVGGVGVTVLVDSDGKPLLAK